MARTRIPALLAVVALSGTLAACGAPAHAGAGHDALVGRVVATGIPGAGAVAAVGQFLPGGPIHDKPALAAATTAGKVLDPARILVASSSNFGAPQAVSREAAGSILSIDTRARAITVPPRFASSGTQATALAGRVQLFSCQAPAFVNGVNDASAVTAAEPGVSNPQDLSINNAFGRLWPANAPHGLTAPGSESILDPGGMPLANPPSTRFGGVYLGAETNRQPAQLTTGALRTGAVGTALMGRALDDPRRAVFAVVTADGAVAQAHTEQGVDGLAPAGTISDLRRAKHASELHVGVVFRYYADDPVLYVSDPVANNVVALTLPKDDVRHVRTLGHVVRYHSPAFDTPVDMAPTQPEGASRDWSSNTTLAELSDIYVLNRGNNTITRMSVDGKVVATRAVALTDHDSLGAAKVNGIATSADGATIYVSVTGRLPGQKVDGGLLVLPAFS